MSIPPETDKQRSIVTDMNWVCEDAWIPAMSQVEITFPNCANSITNTNTYTITNSYTNTTYNTSTNIIFFWNSPSSSLELCLGCFSLGGSGDF